MNFSAPFPSAIGLRVRWIECAAFFCLFCTTALAQTTPAGDYTSALPSVQRVESEMKGTDATDTAARQVAVFEYLQTYIQRIKEARDYRGSYSPGELKLRTDYAKAQYDLTQSFTKTHTAQEVSAFNHLEGQYSVNNALDWIKQMEGQQAADTYKGAEASLSQSYQRNQDRIQKDLKPQQQGGGLQPGGTIFLQLCLMRVDRWCGMLPQVWRRAITRWRSVRRMRNPCGERIVRDCLSMTMRRMEYDGRVRLWFGGRNANCSA